MPADVMTITTERRWPAAPNITLRCDLAGRRVELVLVVLGAEIISCAAILRFDHDRRPYRTQCRPDTLRLIWDDVVDTLQAGI